MTVERLLTAAEAIDRHADPETAEWFSQAIDRWLNHGFALEDALSISSPGPGQRAARTRYVRQLRDHHLRAAFEQIDADLPTTVRAERLASEINRFLSVFWLKWSALSAPPEDCSRLRFHLWYATRAAGGDLPAGWRSLFRIVSGY